MNLAAQHNHALSELLRIATLPIPLEDLVSRSLDALLELSWLSLLPKAGVFLVARDAKGDNCLQLTAERNLGPISEVCAQVRFGQCLCGMAAASRQLVHSAHVDERHETSFDGMAPHGHYNIPILSGEQLLGVLVCYLPDGAEQNEEESEFLLRWTGVLALAIQLRTKESELAEINRELNFQTATLDEHAIVGATDRHGTITYVNAKFCEISGYSADELIGQNHRLLDVGYLREPAFPEVWQQMSNGQVWHGEICNRRKNGRIYWVLATIAPFLDEHGEPYRFVAIGTDITERKDAEAALLQAQTVSSLESWTYDGAMQRYHWSDEVYRILGVDPAKDEPSQELFYELVHPDDRELVVQARQESLRGSGALDVEHRIVRRDNGEVRWVHRRVAHEFDPNGELVRSSGTVEDVTDRYKSQEEVRRLAMTDQLTGLANRNEFHRQCDHHLARSARKGGRLALLMIDLDRFKPVNDQFGHQVGDGVLQRVGQLFQKHCRKTDIISRWGGDEFAILLVDPDDRASIGATAARLITEISRPMVVEDHAVCIGASIGVAVYPDDGSDEDELTFKADAALYKSKSLGRNTYRFWDGEDTGDRTQSSAPPDIS